MAKFLKIAIISFLSLLGVIVLIFGLMAFTGYKMAKNIVSDERSVFAMKAVNEATGKWQVNALMPYMASQYSVGWTNDLRRDSDAILLKTNTPQDIAQIFALGAKNLGPLMEPPVFICKDHKQLGNYCFGMGYYQKHPAAIGLSLHKQNSNVPGQPPYKITSFIIQPALDIQTPHTTETRPAKIGN